MSDPDARLEAALARLGAEHEPPAGWQARVLAATEARRRRPWWWFVVPVVALAAGGLVLSLTISPPRPAPPRSSPLQVAAVPVQRDAVVRATGLALHDVVEVRATGGSGYRALWIYRDEVLVLMCPGAATCHADRDATTVSLRVTSFGVYTFVAVSGPVPVFPSTGAYDADVARAARLNAAIETHIEPVQ